MIDKLLRAELELQAQLFPARLKEVVCYTDSEMIKEIISSLPKVDSTEYPKQLKLFPDNKIIVQSVSGTKFTFIDESS